MSKRLHTTEYQYQYVSKMTTVRFSFTQDSVYTSDPISNINKYYNLETQLFQPDNLI